MYCSFLFFVTSVTHSKLCSPYKQMILDPGYGGSASRQFDSWIDRRLTQAQVYHILLPSRIFSCIKDQTMLILIQIKSMKNTTSKRFQCVLIDRSGTGVVQPRFAQPC